MDFGDTQEAKVLTNLNLFRFKRGFCFKNGLGKNFHLSLLPTWIIRSKKIVGEKKKSLCKQLTPHLANLSTRQNWSTYVDMSFSVIFHGPIIQFESSPRYSTTDHWIQESIKQIFNSGLFWAVGAAEKKIQTAISMLLLRAVFYVFRSWLTRVSVH